MDKALYFAEKLGPDLKPTDWAGYQSRKKDTILFLKRVFWEKQDSDQSDENVWMKTTIPGISKHYNWGHL